MLLRQDEMMVVQGRKRVQRRVFLFEELVIFCKTRKTLGKQDVYDYKTSLKVRSCRIGSLSQDVRQFLLTSVVVI
jgi:hypothetical protein